MGFEPTTFSLARRRSTTELHPLVAVEGYRDPLEMLRNRPPQAPPLPSAPHGCRLHPGDRQGAVEGRSPSRS